MYTHMEQIHSLSLSLYSHLEGLCRTAYLHLQRVAKERDGHFDVSLDTSFSLIAYTSQCACVCVCVCVRCYWTLWWRGTTTNRRLTQLTEQMTLCTGRTGSPSPPPQSGLPLSILNYWNSKRRADSLRNNCEPYSLCVCVCVLGPIHIHMPKNTRMCLG